jgi:raffinose/stachyose/melibiose transport system permease protein
MDRVLRDRRALLVFMAPALILYSAIMLVPIVWSGVYTFFQGSTITGFHFHGIKNYSTLIHDSTFWTSAWFTAKYAVLVTAGQVLAGLGLALLFVFYLKKSSALVRTLTFFPVVLPTTAVAQLFVKMVQISPQNGLLNSALGAIGMTGTEKDWLASPFWALVVLVVMDIWRSMGFYAVLLYAGLVDVPEDVIESARLDGASGWRLVRHIVLPLLTPILVSSLIFSLNRTIKVFDSVVALTNGGPGQATTPLTLLMFNTSFTYGDYGYGSTIAMALTIASLLVTVAIFRSTRKDVTA